MYCRNCGTVVFNDEDLCESCRIEQAIYAPQPTRIDMSKECRGAAIASAAVGVLGIIVSMTLMSVSVFCGDVLLVLLILLSAGAAAMAIIQGVRGIKAFRKACRINADRPIASLICGIVGVSAGGLTVLYTILGLALAIVNRSYL